MKICLHEVHDGIAGRQPKPTEKLLLNQSLAGRLGKQSGEYYYDNSQLRYLFLDIDEYLNVDNVDKIVIAKQGEISLDVIPKNLVMLYYTPGFNQKSQIMNHLFDANQMETLLNRLNPAGAHPEYSFVSGYKFCKDANDYYSF